MPISTRARVVLAPICLGLLSVAACQTGDEKPTSLRPDAVEAPRPPGMPAPLPLPSAPEGVLHLRNPIVFFETLATYDDTVRRAGWQGSAQRAAARGGGAFERALVPHLDPRRSWNAAIVQGQLVAELPLVRANVPAVKQLLANSTPLGRFGAVILTRAAGEKGPKVAWLDEKRATLALADDLRGIATAGELAGTYGAKPLNVALQRERALRYGLDLPVARVSAVGMGPHDFELVTDGFPGGIEGLEQLTTGALTGLVDGKALTWAGSSRYANYRTFVDDILRRASTEVNRQNFFVRGNLQDLLNRARPVLKSWNGKVLIGAAPQQHLVFALGTNDAKAASSATSSLIRGVLDNVELAETFGFGGGIPNLRFAPRKATKHGLDIHVLAVEQARRWIPKDFHGLVDARGDLRVAFAFSPRAEAVVAAAGANADVVLGTWLADVQRAEKAHKDDFVAMSSAVAPGKIVEALLRSDMATLLALRGEQGRTRVVVRRTDKGLRATVEGPRATPPASLRASRVAHP